jgi:hypothetical protein
MGSLIRRAPCIGYDCVVHPEERAIYVVMIVVGTVVLASELARGGPLGTYATLALFMAVAGSIALLRSWLRRPRLPRAQILR